MQYFSMLTVNFLIKVNDFIDKSGKIDDNIGEDVFAAPKNAEERSSEWKLNLMK